MMEMKECTRDNFCYECENARCIFSGSREADCPKYRCDQAVKDCDNCRWLDDWYETVRKEKHGLATSKRKLFYSY